MPRRGATGPRRWALRLTAVLLTLALAAGAAGAAAPAATPYPGNRCCPSHADVSRRNCSDGSPMALDCEAFFHVDPAEDEQDAFTVSADGRELQIRNRSMGRFCLVPSAAGSGDAAYVCFESESRPDWWFEMASALSWVSVACLALTLLAHVLLPELRDLQGRCHMGAVFSLALGLLMLSVLQNVPLQGAPCTAGAFLTYYWLLSAFCWLNVTAFNVWRSVVLDHVRFRERVLFAWYCVVGWGAPVILLLLLLAAHEHAPGDSDPDDSAVTRPHFGGDRCWFHDDRATWMWFYWPMTALLGLNVVYFLWTTTCLWRQYSRQGANQCRRALLRRRFLLSLKLFLIMGISWVFEPISSAADLPSNYAWYLTDTFNVLQGVVILLVLVVLRRKVWRGLHARRLCGLQPPDRWAFPADDPCGGEDACATSTDSDDDSDDEPPSRRLHELKDMSGAAVGNGHAGNGHAAAAAAPKAVGSLLPR